MKKFLSLLLSVILLLSVFTVAASAVEKKNTAVKSYKDYHYTILKDGTVSIKEYKGKSESVFVPSKINNKAVTEIGSRAFENCCSLKAVSLPKGIVKIGSFAFADCTALETVSLPRGLKVIDQNAFLDCTNLKAIPFPDSLFSIGSYAFSGCSSLKDLNGGKGIGEIGQSAFSDTAFFADAKNWKNGALYFKTKLIELKKNVKGSYKVKEGTTVIANGAFNRCNKISSIYIPQSVVSVAAPNKEIYSPCFFACGLKSITVAKNNTKLKSVDGVLYSKDMSVLYRYPAAKAGKSFSVPKSVKTIFDGAFSGSKNLSAVSFAPGSTAYIGNASFDNCKNLRDITLSKGVKVHPYAGFGWRSGKYDDEIVPGFKIKGYSSNKSLMFYLKSFDFQAYFVPLCSDGSENHRLITVKAKNATCFENGHKSYKRCTVCNEKFNFKATAKKALSQSVVSITAAKGELSVKYNAVTGADGFQLIIVDSKDSSKTITKTFTAKKSVTKKITGLNAGEYFVAVKVFKNKNGKILYSNPLWKRSENNQKAVFAVG